MHTQTQTPRWRASSNCLLAAMLQHTFMSVILTSALTDRDRSRIRTLERPEGHPALACEQITFGKTTCMHGTNKVPAEAHEMLLHECDPDPERTHVILGLCMLAIPYMNHAFAFAKEQSMPSFGQTHNIQCMQASCIKRPCTCPMQPVPTSWHMYRTACKQAHAIVVIAYLMPAHNEDVAVVH